MRKYACAAVVFNLMSQGAIAAQDMVVDSRGTIVGKLLQQNIAMRLIGTEWYAISLAGFQDTLYYLSTDCSGTPYMAPSFDIPPNAVLPNDGRLYFAAKPYVTLFVRSTNQITYSGCSSTGISGSFGALTSAAVPQFVLPYKVK